MNIVDLRVYRNSELTPTVIFVDLQLEYLSKDRALALCCPDQAVENCRKLLAFARLRKFPVAHLRWTQAGKFFNNRQDYSQWIEGLSPRASDMVFERSMPSCYASSSFSEMMDSGGGENAIIAGFTGSIACLSTIIDAYHRDHKITFISDASASHALPNTSATDSHRSVEDIISIYAPTMTTTKWISNLSNENEKPGVLND